jgi:hypothetical protein
MPGELEKGFAIICREDGVIKSVVHDSSDIFAKRGTGANLISFAGENSANKLLDFVSLANSADKAFGYRISLGEGSASADYSLWGIKYDKDIYIIGIIIADPVKKARSYLTALQQTGGLGHENAFQEVGKIVLERIGRDAEVYDELTRLNNELINLQRQLTKNNLQLQQALENIKTLKGLIPICASCKKVRNDQGYWQQVEEYVSQHTEADFSHSLCEECARKLYPENFDKEKKENIGGG